MVRCGVVWHGVVWYGVVWYGMVWYGVESGWYDMLYFEWIVKSGEWRVESEE